MLETTLSVRRVLSGARSLRPDTTDDDTDLGRGRIGARRGEGGLGRGLERQCIGATAEWGGMRGRSGARAQWGAGGLGRVLIGVRAHWAEGSDEGA